ncbi:serine/threonine-protein kinase [Streptomyces hyaluromycini]|uniref:non-specific serine/threonine protein kinase n=1 Tax=Streptomyces hyaluromycini TaxID=1377993 RepID=A0ABV1X2J7_9ACTN
MIGAQIAGYQVEREIGRGEMAVVYRAKDVRLDRVVALKILAPEAARDPGFRRRFTHDSRTVAAIDHPNIVPIFEAGEIEGLLYIAMLYVSGPDLRTLLDRDGPLPVADSLSIAAQAAAALDAAHERGVVHGGVKPGNILLAEGTDSDHSYHAYLTDFGVANGLLSLHLSGFRTVGQFVGTLDYMAPEQTSGRPMDERSDLYSLACVVYETLAGGPPFERDDDLALLWAHQYDPPPALSERCPGIAPAVDAVMAKALAKSPEDRYGSCREFEAELRAAAAADAPEATRTSPCPASPSPPPLPGWAAGATPPGPPFDDDDDEW